CELAHCGRDQRLGSQGLLWVTASEINEAKLTNHKVQHVFRVAIPLRTAVNGVGRSDIPFTVRMYGL
ncbi:hypothetical protein F442_23132, partial [Phytophthora nicotianae P10297]